MDTKFRCEGKAVDRQRIGPGLDKGDGVPESLSAANVEQLLVQEIANLIAVSSNGRHGHAVGSGDGIVACVGMTPPINLKGEAIDNQ